MPKYTVWIRSFTELQDTVKTRIEQEVGTVLRKYQGATVATGEFEINVGDGAQESAAAWMALKDATEKLAYVVWLNHATKGVTASDTPPDFAEALSLTFRDPTNRHAEIRNFMQRLF